MRLHYLLGAAAVALAVPAAASAQETTAAIRGTVTSAGTPVANATVIATDVGSGTKAQTTTDASGTFTLSGLRAGGPFTVDVTSAQGNKSVTDVYTVVQQTFSLPVELNEAATAGATADNSGATADVVVTATSIRGAGVVSQGPSTVLRQADIQKVASVNRDVRDVERRDPFANIDRASNGDRGGAVAFAGVNSRFNRFTINGVTVGDTFGLNQDASPTNRGPVPFDAIGQVSTSVAPYDFRQSGFQGGAIDTVLLKGTNEFHGTGFYSQNTDGLSGDRIGSTKIVLPKYKSETYGAMLRGPLIKDRLFFMVAAERNTDPRPFSTLPGQIPGLTATTIPTVNGITASGRYPAFQPGDVLGLNPRKDEKIVGQVDLNITDGQRLSLSYINSYDSLVSQNNTATGAANPSYGLSSNAYALTELLKAGIVQLNSDWTDQFSTEVRGLYKYSKRGQEPLLGRNTGQFGVCTDPTDTTTPSGATQLASLATGCSTGTPRIFFGPDNSRQTNQLFFDTWAGSFLARYRAGGHEVKLLAEITENRTFNNFVQNSLGSWYFDSLADYRLGRANQLIYAAEINGPGTAAANFHYTQYTFGFQDDWQATPDLLFTYGVRESLYAMDDRPIYDPFYQARYGVPNTKTYKGLDQFEPRVSFNYKPSKFLAGVRLRGGAGIFGGGSPDIYLSNSFSNTLTTNQVTINRYLTNGTVDPTCNVAGSTCDLALNNVTGVVNPNLRAIATNTATNAAFPNTNTGSIAQNWHLPRSLKATLSADYTLFGVNIGADYYYSNTVDSPIFTDIRSVVVGQLPDGRPRYGNISGNFADNNYDVQLGSSSKGRSHIGVVRIDKTFDWGLSLGGSYTLEDIRDTGNATSSTINSNYRFQVFADPNRPVLGTSDQQTKWIFKYSLGYDHAFFRDYKTRFQLFGESRAGKPYSIVMNDLANSTNRSAVFGTVQTGSASTNLLYVPTSTTDPLVSYDSAATQAALDGLINGTALSKYRGQIAAKNILRSRANTTIDLHLEQEVPTFIGKSKVSVFADINNFTNLLNSKWGGLRQVSPTFNDATASVVSVQCLSRAIPTGFAVANINATAAQNPTGLPAVGDTTSSQVCAQYRYSSYVGPNAKNLNITQSLYTIRIGARFTF
ncbi:TonB-dependent receptor [Sphingomonas bacterium]|uniref:TonB-dependent receptor n=1 Tax=Sphingomonas bacterium TaxID=1895847 RepID=UPI0015768675|nr:carboxypeptidase-like regulatory domain-containing protein [Sphingomonas bacterium]